MFKSFKGYIKGKKSLRFSKDGKPLDHSEIFTDKEGTISIDGKRCQREIISYNEIVANRKNIQKMLRLRVKL